MGQAVQAEIKACLAGDEDESGCLWFLSDLACLGCSFGSCFGVLLLAAAVIALAGWTAGGR